MAFSCYFCPGLDPNTKEFDWQLADVRLRTLSRTVNGDLDLRKARNAVQTSKVSQDSWPFVRGRRFDQFMHLFGDLLDQTVNSDREISSKLAAIRVVSHVYFAFCASKRQKLAREISEKWDKVSMSEFVTLWVRANEEASALREMRGKIEEFFASLKGEDPESVKGMFYNIRHDLERLLVAMESLDFSTSQKVSMRASMRALQDNRFGLQMRKAQNRAREQTDLITALLFVFAPLSLTTSIFAMNVKPINKGNFDIRVVLVTAVVLLSIAGIIWGISALVVYLRHRDDPDDDDAAGNVDANPQPQAVPILAPVMTTAWSQQVDGFQQPLRRISTVLEGPISSGKLSPV